MHESSAKAEDLVTQGYFPLLKELALYRSDRVSMLAHHYGSIMHNLLESLNSNSACKKPTSDKSSSSPDLLRWKNCKA